MAKAAITRAIASQRLHEVLPGVYSVIPPQLMSDEARHAAAILAGGEGACLCGASGAWWVEALAEPPAEIHVAVRGPRRPVDGIRWHRLKLGDDERVNHRQMPVTSLARVPLDMAAGSNLRELQSVLAELEFRHDVEIAAIAATLRKGYAGSALLRRAIAQHVPQLAHTRSRLEQEFAHFLVTRGFELPEFNHPVGLSTVDALYAGPGVVVELDGVKGHSGERRVLRDHRRDLHRRADGLLTVRYAYAQLTDPRDQLLIEAELERLGIPRHLSTGSREPR